MISAIVVLLLSAVAGIHSQNELGVLFHPSSVGLPETASLTTSQLPSLANKILGIQSEQSLKTEWPGTFDLWSRPEALVAFVVTSDAGLTLTTSVPNKYELTQDVVPDFDETFSQIRKTFSGKKYVVLDVSSEIDGTYSGKIDRLPLDVNSIVANPKNLLVTELTTARGVGRWVSGSTDLRNGVPDVFVFHFQGLDQLVQRYGADSAEVAEGKRLLAETIDNLAADFKKVYANQCFIEIVTLNPYIERVRRAPGDTPASTAAPDKTGDICAKYKDIPCWYLQNFASMDYAVIFNIILFVMLSLGLSVFGVSVWIWFMDPGRDSLIYRMTMTRAKRD